MNGSQNMSFTVTGLPKWVRLIWWENVACRLDGVFLFNSDRIQFWCVIIDHPISGLNFEVVFFRGVLLKSWFHTVILHWRVYIKSYSQQEQIKNENTLDSIRQS